MNEEILAKEKQKCILIEVKERFDSLKLETMKIEEIKLGIQYPNQIFPQSF